MGLKRRPPCRPRLRRSGSTRGASTSRCSTARGARAEPGSPPRSAHRRRDDAGVRASPCPRALRAHRDSADADQHGLPAPCPGAGGRRSARGRPPPAADARLLPLPAERRRCVRAHERDDDAVPGSPNEHLGDRRPRAAGHSGATLPGRRPSRHGSGAASGGRRRANGAARARPSSLRRRTTRRRRSPRFRSGSRTPPTSAPAAGRSSGWSSRPH